jgi:hypothetical protein
MWKIAGGQPELWQKEIFILYWKKMSLNLSSLLKVDVSTYENPTMDCVYEQMQYDLDECKDKNKMIEVQGIGKIKIDDIDYDDWLEFENFKIDLGQAMQEALERDVKLADKITLQEVFARYGLEYAGMYFYTPNAYNYESDSLKIRLKVIDWDWSVDKYWLRELIEEYIENVRLEPQESYDGYMSLEPTDIDEVGIDDYCTLWAILKKEW